MKIAMMVRGFLPAPAPGDIVYSPLSIAIDVAEGLAARGHSVTFFGPEGTHLKCKIETLGVQSLVKDYHELNELVSVTDLFLDYIPSLYDQYMARDMLERAQAGEFDAVVFNHPESSVSLTRLFPKVPSIYILHDELNEKRRTVFDMFQSENQHYISISDNQRRDAPDLQYLATIHNGIDTTLFPYSETADNYLLFAGRIVPEKGVREAVQVAIAANKRLIIIGQLPPTSYAYFDEHIKPYLSNRVLYVGTIDRGQMAKYYQKAQALLAPIQWEEPFGLTIIEAMSCGTPVIAFNRGSVPEIIKDGETGFIVNNTAEMVEAVAKIPTIKRKDCRDHVARNFTVSGMLTQYEKAFTNLIKTN